MAIVNSIVRPVASSLLGGLGEDDDQGGISLLATLLVAPLAGLNFGYNSAVAGDLTPNVIGSGQINYFGSFGESYFNVRTVGDVKIDDKVNMLVNIQGVSKTNLLLWSAINNRYEGNWPDIAALLGAQNGNKLTVTVVAF